MLANTVYITIVIVLWFVKRRFGTASSMKEARALSSGGFDDALP